MKEARVSELEGKLAEMQREYQQLEVSTWASFLFPAKWLLAPSVSRQQDSKAVMCSISMDEASVCLVCMVLASCAKLKVCRL